MIDTANSDIIDESISLFRINAFYKQFEVRGKADILLVYVMSFISECLTKVGKREVALPECLSILTSAAQNDLTVPGDEKFPLNNLFRKPEDKKEEAAIKEYLLQLRSETAKRLTAAMVAESSGKESVSPWWKCFHKRKFLQNKIL